MTHIAPRCPTRTIYELPTDYSKRELIGPYHDPGRSGTLLGRFYRVPGRHFQVTPSSLRTTYVSLLDTRDRVPLVRYSPNKSLCQPSRIQPLKVFNPSEGVHSSSHHSQVWTERSGTWSESVCRVVTWGRRDYGTKGRRCLTSEYRNHSYIRNARGSE